MSLAAGTRLGPYEIVAAIGAGGMGEVYRARDTRLDRTVAIKVLPASLSADPSLRQRFEREARTISSFDHPHICGLYDVGAQDGREYLVMQYLEGETLAARLERGPLPVGEALRIGAQIADALAAAHRRGIVHRDLKPGNVMLTPSGAVRQASPQAKLLDFGLAKASAPAGPATVGETLPALTAERSILGTLNYMSPEQLEGREADARSDIFSLGTVLYEMLTGRRAFGGESPASTIASILSSEPKPLAEAAPLTPPTLDRIVAHCLAKNPDDRWQSASDLAFELREVDEAGGRAPATAPSASARRTTTLLWLAALAAAGVVGTFAGALFAPSRDAPHDTARAPREVRLTLLPPPGHEFAGNLARFDMDFAVSPDGMQLAFIATDPSGTNRLWIRSIASTTARMIPGTEGAERPFWSPDSRSVGFKTDAGICRVLLPDGNLQVIVPASSVDLDSKGSWSDGRIFFERGELVAGRSVRMVFTVPESGGAVTAVARGKHPQSETGQRYPDALPDGRRFIYLSWAADPAERAIFVGSLDSDERTQLVRTGFRAEFVAPDTLLYIRDRALVAQRLSPDRSGLIGEPRIIVEQLALEGIPGQAGFAASDSGVIAYRSRTREVESELRWIDRKGSASEPLAPRGSDITAALSPDGRRVATTRLVQTSSEERLPGNIWLIDLARGIPSRFTLDASRIDENPVWSPDGRRIAYASHKLLALAEVRVQEASEPGLGTLLFNPAENFHPIDWSPDGRHLLLQGYGTGAGADNIDLWVVEPRAGAEPRPLVQQPALQSQGQFSPDGKWIAYTSDESGRPEVYLRSFPAGQARIQVSSAGGAQPRWRGDSRELFYVAKDGTVMAVPVGSDGTPAAPIALFKEPSLRVNNYVFFYGGAAGYAVARDGLHFLVNRLTREPQTGPIQLVINPAGLK